MVPRSFRSLPFAVAVASAATAAGFAMHSPGPAASAAAPAKLVYEIQSTLSSNLIDLHRVAWRRAVLPGRVCGVHRSLRLRNGKAMLGAKLEVDAGWHRVAYGDLDSDRRDEAALSVACSNGGGTADSVWAYAVVIFTPGARAPVALAILRPQHHRAHMPATLVEVRISPRRIVGSEAFYGPADGTCCPSGRAVSVWVYRRGRLQLAKTRVTREPSP
jgi:hypothetical protein